VPAVKFLRKPGLSKFAHLQRCKPLSPRSPHAKGEPLELPHPTIRYLAGPDIPFAALTAA